MTGNKVNQMAKQRLEYQNKNEILMAFLNHLELMKQPQLSAQVSENSTKTTK